ncbi:complex I NDUFA9 subunit family protein [Sphingosinicellaceae bacterium]|nr:complex I NDUFA9 subunit family protein [Sphingosinicellaceae bacterium]
MDGLVVVVGGGGFVGRYLVQVLAKTGVRIRVVSRNPEGASFLKPLGGLGDIQIVRGNVRDAASMARAFDGATAGVNLVGILAEGGSQRFDAVQARGAGTVAEAARNAGVAAFVQVSAIGADANSPAGYARTKAAGEAAVLKALPHATIVRPGIVFGREDQFINRFAALTAQLPVVPVVAGKTRFQPVYVLDVAHAIAAALADPAKFGGQVYSLGGPRIYSFREILTWIRDQVRPGKTLLDIPDAAAALMAKLGNFVPGAPMTQDQWLMLQRDTVVVPGDLGLADLGIEATPMESIAPAYLERYKTGGRFHRDPLVA